MQEIRYKGAVLANTHLKLLNLLNTCLNALFPAILDFFNQVQFKLFHLKFARAQYSDPLSADQLRKMNKSGRHSCGRKKEEE